MTVKGNMSAGSQVTFSMILAQLLSKQIEVKQLSQKDFLAECKISQATWSRINRGLTSFSIEDLNAACRVLGMRCSELIRNAEVVEAGLPMMDVNVVAPVGPSAKSNYAGAFIAGAVLAFLISRLGK